VANLLAMHDSGVGSIGGEFIDGSPNGARSLHIAGACPSGRSHASTFQSSADFSAAITVVYYGGTALDRRHTPAMLPWITADVRRTGERRGVRRVQLLVGSNALKAFEMTASCEIPIFEHTLQSMTRFSRSALEPRCFSYLTRPYSDLPFTCHVFLADEALAVS
jgi:hypothetical protein